MSGGVAAFFVLLSHVKKFLQVRDHLLYCSPERSVLFEVVKHLLPVFDGFNVGGNIIYKFIAVPERTEKTHGSEHKSLIETELFIIFDVFQFAVFRFLVGIKQVNHFYFLQNMYQ